MNRRKYLAVILAAIGGVALFGGSRIVASLAAFRPDARQEIPRLAELMQWKPGSTVADIGAGDGTYSFAAEKIVGASGHIYATEIDAAKLAALRDENLGVRIEDDVLVTADGHRVMTEKLPRNADEVEKVMAEGRAHPQEQP